MGEHRKGAAGMAPKLGSPTPCGPFHTCYILGVPGVFHGPPIQGHVLRHCPPRKAWPLQTTLTGTGPGPSWSLVTSTLLLDHSGASPAAPALPHQLLGGRGGTPVCSPQTWSTQMAQQEQVTTQSHPGGPEEAESTGVISEGIGERPSAEVVTAAGG